MKPEGLFIHVRRRDVRIAAATQAAVEHARQAEAAAEAAARNGVPIRVLYGSNAGTSKDFAQRIANDAGRRGYSPTIGPLDEAGGGLGTGGARRCRDVLLRGAAAGQRPKICGLDRKPAAGRPHGGAVHGLRQRQQSWARTYQEVPKAIDARLEAAGATRVLPRGEANARGDFFGDFEEWYAGSWPAVDATLGQRTQPADSAARSWNRSSSATSGTRCCDRTGPAPGTVVANRELVDLAKPGARSKRHVEIALPEGMSYRTGDYLAVLPLNPSELVQRAPARFSLDVLTRTSS